MPVGGGCGQIACDPKPRARVSCPSTRLPLGESLMTWIKPEFEFVDLCSEVTSYLYHR